MNIAFKRAILQDAEMIQKGQIRCFGGYLNKYHDDEANPCNESLESIRNSIMNQFFYKILADDKFAGAIYVHENPDAQHFKLHTVFILPEYQGLGLCQKAIDYIEEQHSEAFEWELETPHDLTRNHHVYEKKGYRRTGIEFKVNDNMTLIHYRKSINGGEKE
ncbi:MAG TPA: GNAT family N-acetyltransferase [Clostridia bacterium]|nr:GNAT family N-acetyltransferase [Clostridia bacterium]